MKLLTLALLLFVCSCAEKSEKASSGSNANREKIVGEFNKIVVLQNESIDSARVAWLARAAAAEPSEYQAMALLAKGTYYNNESAYELGLKSFEKALRKVREPSADTLKALAYNGIGNCYKHTGDYPKALRNLYEALEIFENHDDKNGIANTNAYLGEVHMQKGDFSSARENLKIALKLLDHEKGRAGWLAAAHTLANVYGMSGDYGSALEIAETGIRISDSIKSPGFKSSFLDNKANCYMFAGKLDSAEYYFRECLRIDLASGSKKQIADSYSNLGKLASLQNNFLKAESLALKSIDILQGINNKYNLGKSYQILSEIYVRKGDYKKALEVNQKFFEAYKKMVNEKKEASLAEFRILHETDHKERELAENRVELLQKDAEVGRRNNLLIFLSVLLLFIALLAWMLNRQQKLKTRQMAQEHELKTAIAHIETQNKLQNQRLEISRDLHDNIGAQLTFIISSVENLKYVFDIGNVQLDGKLNSISHFTRETIVELRDTIWAMNHNQISFEDLRARILNFIEKAKIATEKTAFVFSIEESLDAVKLSSVQAMNIYRTIQEAVNNALKYARADAISIQICPESDRVKIEIKDNGRGFDVHATARGNGLNNMEKRIGDIGGEFLLRSREGRGTEILIFVLQDSLVDSDSGNHGRFRANRIG